MKKLVGFVVLAVFIGILYFVITDSKTLFATTKDNHNNTKQTTKKEPQNSNILTAKDPSQKTKIQTSYSSLVLDEGFISKQADTIIIGTIKEVQPERWNSPNGQVKNLGNDAIGFKGYSWMDNDGYEKSEDELGVFGAVTFQDYLIDVEEVLKDNKAVKNAKQSDETFNRMTKWEPELVSNSSTIRCRLVDPSQYNENSSYFNKGQRVLLMLTKQDNITSKVGPDHYIIEPKFYSFKLTSDGYAVRDNVPVEKAKLPLSDLLNTIKAAI